MSGYEAFLKRSLGRKAALDTATSGIDRTAVYRAIELIESVYRKDGTIYVFGNGGSSTDAHHWASEFLATQTRDGIIMRALALNDPYAMSATVNDYPNGSDLIFKNQLRNAHRGDVAIGISTSGKAKNVHTALDYAKYNDIHRIGVVGNGLQNHEIIDRSDIAIVMPSSETPTIQECCSFILHDMWLELIEKFGGRV